MSPALTDRAASRLAPTRQLVETGVVAILRARSGDHVQRAADALVDAGITCLEVTLTIPGALTEIAALSERLPAEVVVGAGSVTSGREAVAATDAGAAFLVSPAVCADVLSFADAAGVPCYPGAWTPTEVLTAWQSGATAVKIFPAASGGPKHLRSLHEPLPGIPLVPTGGITAEDAPGYLAAGALAVGMGSPLLGDALDGGDLTALRDRARRLLDAIAASKQAR